MPLKALASPITLGPHEAEVRIIPEVVPRAQRLLSLEAQLGRGPQRREEVRVRDLVSSC